MTFLFTQKKKMKIQYLGRYPTVSCQKSDLPLWVPSYGDVPVILHSHRILSRFFLFFENFPINFESVKNRIVYVYFV